MEIINDFLARLQLNYFFSNIKNFTIFSLIDILIVAYGIYKVLIWIKETRAWSLFKGIAILFFISFLSYLFELDTISWILSNTLDVGIMAIIIIFQPEIRRALEELGKTSKNLNKINEHENISSKTIDEILISVVKMAQEGIGALIVIENAVPLGEHKNTGIPINADVTSQLLTSIFQNKTPLHDGAVIIQNNKISAASCILPLTDKNIDPSLGTRHRAALGLSEISDAFIIVVSEETCSLSLAHKGKLNRKITEENLRKTIKFSDNKNSKKKKPLKKIWTKKKGS